MAKSTRSHAPVDYKARERDWSDILKQAVAEPGKLLSAYHNFHNYSMGNVLLAWVQCEERSMPLGPIAPFRRWEQLGRSVKKGEKAIVLCMPLPWKKTTKDADGSEVERRGVFFKWPARWFVMAQTEGEDVTLPPLPDWDFDRALSTLGITREPFSLANGNTQGYSRGKTLAINPVAQLPYKTAFHEIAHSILHFEESEAGTLHLTDEVERNLREVEAEATALLVLSVLGLEGAEYCRGYLQSWWGTGNEIPSKNAQRVMSAADKILKAGYPAKKEEIEEEEDSE